MVNSIRIVHTNSIATIFADPVPTTVTQIVCSSSPKAINKHLNTHQSPQHQKKVKLGLLKNFSSPTYKVNNSVHSTKYHEDQRFQNLGTTGLPGLIWGVLKLGWTPRYQKNYITQVNFGYYYWHYSTLITVKKIGNDFHSLSFYIHTHFLIWRKEYIHFQY